MNQERLEIGTDMLGRVRRHALAGYPEEICGGLLGRRDAVAVRVAEVVPLHNERDDERDRRYLIGPDDVLSLEKRAEASDQQVIGFYHSHPDAAAVPSDYDRQHAWPGYVYLIVAVADGEAREAAGWQLTDERDRFVPLTLSHGGPERSVRFDGREGTDVRRRNR